MHATSFSVALLLALTVTLVQQQACAHSFLTNPAAFNRVFRVHNNCKGAECTSACPVINKKGVNMANTASRPARTWKRGQRVSIRWTKNNHEGGLLRLALVPAGLASKRAYHSQFAFYYGCWEQGLYTCSGTSACGSDTGNKAFRRTVKIPEVFPDGVYVLGFVWYGGLEFTREKGLFPDYYSCSYVRIRGGAAVKSNFQPFWAAGDTGRFRRGNKCLTSSRNVGKCGRFGCPNTQAFYGVERAFQNGGLPPKITSAAVTSAFSISDVV